MAETDQEVGERLTVRIPTPLMARIERLIGHSELGFTSLEHFLMAGLHSFVSYKERQVSRLRADAEGGR